MIERVIQPRVRNLARKFPVVTITGPRQSGKTTLCHALFPEKRYVSLEALDTRAYAQRDPRGFLAECPDGAVLDDVHRVPDLLPFIQERVDARRGAGQFILTGSANFALLESTGQSLAGRTALVTLLPLSLEEIRRFPDPPEDLFDLLWRGSYPACFDRALAPGDWYPSYTATYLERDMRSLLAVGDLLAFQTFLRLCAGRTAQLVNLSALGADAGVSQNTAKAWLSVLEAGYIAWRLPPFHANLGKRLVKTPKLHFLDSGLVCSLLGIQSASQLRHHPLRGAIFETWVAAEIFKARAHRGLAPRLSFFRDRKGAEVDLIVELGEGILAVETKSGQTVADDFFSGLRALARAVEGRSQTPRARAFVVYGGADLSRRPEATVVSWSAMDRTHWWDAAEGG